MTISEVLSALQNDQAIVIRDKTFTPKTVDSLLLDTGETVYWAYGKDGLWLSIDPSSEEVMVFEDIDEELEPEDDTVVYQGDDYEFSYEGSATLKEDETGGMMTFRDFENSSGDVIRMTEYEATGDVVISRGHVLTEEEMQEA